jgi:hypothetical protein
MKPERMLRQRVLLPIGTLLLMGLIYPGGPFLGQILGEDDLAQCTYIPIHVVGSAYLIILLFLILMPLAYRRLNSAIYVMITGILGGAAVGLWFIATSFSTVLCVHQLYPARLFAIFAFILVLTASFFVLYMLPRIQKTVEYNSQKWNFTTMEYSILAPTYRPDGISSHNIMRLSVIGGVAGIILPGIALPFNDPQLQEIVRQWLGSSALFIGGLWFIAILVPSELHAVWIVHKMSKSKGQKMTVKEFSN